MPANSYLFISKDEKAVMYGKWERFVVVSNLDHGGAWQAVLSVHPTRLDEKGYAISHLGTSPSNINGTTVVCSQVGFGLNQPQGDHKPAASSDHSETF